MTRLKIDRFLMEIDYLDKLFDMIFRKFLNAIDHIEYHPTLQEEPTLNTRSKCSTFFDEQRFYTPFEHRLTPAEELFVDK